MFTFLCLKDHSRCHAEKRLQRVSGSRETPKNTVSIINLSWSWSSADGRKWLDPACTLMLK